MTNEKQIIPKEKQNVILKEIQQMQNSIVFFAQLMTQNELDNTSITTHTTIWNSCLRNIQKNIGYDYEKTENTILRKRLQKANQTINALQTTMGKQMSAEAIENGIRVYQDILRAWYESFMVHYASIKPNSTSFEIDMCMEIHDTSLTPHLCQNQDVFEQFKEIHKNIEFKTTQIDMRQLDILFCEENIAQLQKTFKKDFPNSRIINIYSRENDNHELTLCLKAYVYFIDIAQYLKRSV